ncbi:EpsG family protein [Paraburkholderia unamae]|uniref:EpsG-like putative glucosyltransferase n=1 Tax=Paraburkholderia unamae TaxID=219649 RepID=A0ABX5KBC2_9BURK|nr:EpsG family protein [Paraburkholderia unamae]PVX72843.1 EpsG-like putative glucosyltransferase [Paraburkholderia unamae]RAR54202.1 EpsG-like putative glucosyltransferase [Paraburkholderia unamae]CAG9272591.1 conserved membrane hypothetical protein [Paraburkholderia unamae]
MTYYLLPLLVFYLGVALCLTYGGTNRAVIVVCSIPMIALVVLRGHSGTDTAAYYTAFMDLGEGGTYGGEPLFNGYAHLLWAIYPDPRFVTNAISATTCALLIFSIARNRYGAWFGGLLLVPAMFYELTMNVMRFGLASSIFILATRVPMQRNPVRYFIYMAIGTCTHFSSILLFLFFIAATRRGQTPLLIGVSIVAVGASFLMPDYIADKGNLYSGIAAPSASSGLLLLIVQILILRTMIVFRKQFDIPPVGWVVCGGLALAFYGLTQITYAGIRFQLILVVLMVVMLWRQFAPQKPRVSPRLAAWLFVIGCVALLGRVHNMVDEEGHGESPFIPYQLAPTLQQLG